MWKLYLLLKPAIDSREMEEYVYAELYSILDSASEETLLECMYVMYDNKDMPSDGLESAMLTIRTLLKNQFLDFCAHMRGFNGSG